MNRSAAAAAGLKVGDELLEIGGKPAASLEAARDALLGLPDRGAPLALVVQRDRERVSLLLTDPKATP